MTEEERIEQERKRQQQEQADYSWLSWLNPFSYSFGTLLLFGIVAAGVYFFGFNDKGKQMLGELFEKLPDDWKSTLLGWGESLGLVPEGGKEMADFARANGVPTSELLSGGAEAILNKPDLMYNAMLEIPDTVLKLARNAPKDKADEKTTQQAMAAMRTIVSDTTKLATLLNSTNKANTYALLEAVSPIPMKAGALGTFVDKVGMKDGRPTSELQQVLLAVLDEKATETSRTEALMKFAQRDPGALAALLDGVDTTKDMDEAQRTQIESAKQQPKASLGPIMKIDANLRKHGTSIGAVAQAADSPEALVNMLLDRTQRTALFAGNAELIGQAMRGYEKQTQAALPALTNPAERSAAEAQLNFFRFMNTGSPDAQGTWRATNVRAINTLFTQIEGSAFSASHPKATRQVLTGMLELMTGNPGASKKLDSNLVAAFFADEKNAAAFGQFLATINPGRLPSTEGNDVRGLATALKKHWGTKDKGLRDILDSPSAVAFLLSGAGGSPIIINELSGVSRWIADAGNGWFGTPPVDIGDNLSTLGAIQQALISAGVEAAPKQSAAASGAQSPAAAIAGTRNGR